MKIKDYDSLKYIFEKDDKKYEFEYYVSDEKRKEIEDKFLDEFLKENYGIDYDTLSKLHDDNIVDFDYDKIKDSDKFEEYINDKIKEIENDNAEIVFDDYYEAAVEEYGDLTEDDPQTLDEIFYLYGIKKID